MKFSLSQLRAFVSVAETRSFSTSATRLHVTQPTLSATIRTLEGLVEAKLFDRDTRNVAMTPVGEEFLAIAKRVLDEVERAQHDLKQFLVGGRGRVRFAALPVLFGSEVLQQAIASFRQACPNIELEIHDLRTECSVDLLKSHRLDLALITQVAADAELEPVAIGTQTIAVLLPAAHPMAAAAAIRCADLVREPIVALNAKGPMSLYFDQLLYQADLRLQRTYRVGQLVTAAGLVRAGLGLGIMSGLSAQLMAGEDLVCRPLVDPQVARPISLVSLAGRELSPAAQRFRQILLDGYARSPIQA